MMKRSIIFTFIFSLFSHQFVSAQPNPIIISGKVSDFVTHSDLDEVTIYVTNLTNGVTDSTLTNSSGDWQMDLSITSIRDIITIPKSFQVSPNYPNPFNPSTKIDFLIPTAGLIKVKIYNVLGEIVDAQQEYLSPGTYSIEWSGKGSAGVYFLKLETTSGSVIRKMTQLDALDGEGLSEFRSTNLNHTSFAKISSAVSISISTKKFGYLPFTLEAEVTGGEYFEFSIETIHSHSLLADLHNDVLEKMLFDPTYHWADYHTYNHTDIPRLIQGGVDVQLFVAWVSPNASNYYNTAMTMVDIFNNEISLNTEDMEQARNKTEALSIVNNNKIAAVLVVEGGHIIENDLNKLIALYEVGMRYLTITWNNSTPWAISAQDSRSSTVGLSEFGKQVIRTMDSLGVIIDISHTGIKTIEDILETSSNPIIASHSGVRSLRNHYRNLYDDQITAIANSGGVVGVVFYPPFLSYTGSADISTVTNHIDYIVNLVGVDYAALGSDFDGIGTNTVQGLDDVSKFPDLTLELLRRGYSQSDIEKILGGNFMRVFEQVCGL